MELYFLGMMVTAVLLVKWTKEDIRTGILPSEFHQYPNATALMLTLVCSGWPLAWSIVLAMGIVRFLNKGK